MLKQTPDGIKSAAMDFDNAIEKMDIDELVEFFTDDCEVIVLDEILKGKNGVRKFFNWLFANIVRIKFDPVNIMVKNDVFFEEFTVKAKLPDGTSVVSNQAEVLVYENYKIKSLRLYFDRLDFANAIATDFISKGIIKTIVKRSLKGLRE
ncbi:MAG: nuclear transport factor 2 family protein [Candidatus Heimdallarchaeota archaeon]|nr:nuclear transport factor 2 family protein [Candidatus Heimdallarchaeota archaeon]MBY8995064.1 nuclear transport factor 2 family protein [Candidatus Heimdallarchaeota archaeon]